MVRMMMCRSAGQPRLAAGYRPRNGLVASKDPTRLCCLRQSYTPYPRPSRCRGSVRVKGDGPSALANCRLYPKGSVLKVRMHNFMVRVISPLLLPVVPNVGSIRGLVGVR